MTYLIPDELADATSYLYHHHRPWMTYSSLVPLEYKIIQQDENAEDAWKACTYANVIAFSSWFAKKVAKLPGYAAYVIAHEIGHQQLQHHIVHERWRTAGRVTGRVRDNAPYVTYPFVSWIAQHAWDFQINDGINMTGMNPPEDALWDQSIGTFWDIEEDIYVRYYEKQMGKNGGQSPDEENNPGGDGKPGAGMPDVLPDAIGSGRFDEDQRRVNAFQKMLDAIDQEAAKSRGFDAGKAEGMFKRKCVKPMPWHQIIRPSIETALGGSRSTWNKVNNPAFSMGYVLQGNMRKAAGEVAVIVDTSASMSLDELAACFEHMVSMFSTCLPRKMHVIEADTTVQRYTAIKHPRELRGYVSLIERGGQGFKGRGGTTLTCAHNYLIEHDIHPDVTLYLTDMGTDFPAGLGNSKRVFWISTMPHGQAPEAAGVTLRMTRE